MHQYNIDRCRGIGYNANDVTGINMRLKHKWGEGLLVKRWENGGTIAEIAKIAGVSKMTVSRVINNKGNVAEKTRVRIEEVIREQNYSPNVFAQSLASSKTGIIGMVADRDSALASEFQSIVLGVESQAYHSGYDVLFMADRREKDFSVHFRRSLMEGVVYYGHKMDMLLIEYLETHAIPYVMAGKRNVLPYTPDFSSADYYNGYYEVTNYLLGLGHKRIAMLGGHVGFPADTLKYEGYWDALKDAGLPRDRSLEITGDLLDQLVPLLQAGQPTALLVSGAAAWNKLLNLVAEGRCKIPQDYSVIISGLQMHSDSESIRYLLGIQEMTRLEIPDYQMGAQTAQRLIEKINGKEKLAKENYIPMTFIKGDSCQSIL